MYNDSNAYPQIKQMLKIYMIINNPNCKHKSRKKGGESSITSMVVTSGPDWFCDTLKHQAIEINLYSVANTLDKIGYASRGLTKEEQRTQTYERSGNSERHAKLRATL